VAALISSQRFVMVGFPNGRVAKVMNALETCALLNVNANIGKPGTTT
jgi:hypothetical protein